MESNERDDTIRIIRTELKRRSGKTWSVKGGRGTAWGWITITAPPKRAADQWGTMTAADAAELGALLGLDGPAHCQGHSVPASREHRIEITDRVRGLSATTAEAYWD